MSARYPEVDAWFDRYGNPLKPLVQRVREIILDADPRIGEEIKWSTPTFVYGGNLASFQPRAKRFVSVLLRNARLLTAYGAPSIGSSSSLGPTASS